MTSGSLLDYSDWAAPVVNLGPGKRLILWVRGCPLACPGCMTPELWDSAPPSSHRPVAELAASLAPLLLPLDGLSISGGEPALQAAALTELIRLLRTMPGLEELEVLSYSGFTWEELQNMGPEVATYLSQLDLLVDGRYEQGASNNLQWRGSDNQRAHLLSQRAQKYAENADEVMPEPRPLQLQMLDAGRYRIIGIPKRGDLAAYRGAMSQVGLPVRPDIPRPHPKPGAVDPLP